MAVTLASCLSNPKCLILDPHQSLIPNKHTIKAALLPHQNPDRSLTMISKPSPCRDTAIATALLSTLASEPAMAIQQVAEVAPEDDRFLAILLPIIPAMLWVLYNILGPALNQVERMRSEKGVIVGLGLGGCAALHFVDVPNASASESDAIGEVASDYMSLHMLGLVITLALHWASYNILEPKINKMKEVSESFKHSDHGF